MSQPKRKKILLKDFLEQRLKDGSVPGLEWVDKSTQKFKIPWKKQLKNCDDWKEESKLFRDWYMRTSTSESEKEGSEAWASWKATFRAALTSKKSRGVRVLPSDDADREEYKLCQFYQDDDDHVSVGDSAYGTADNSPAGCLNDSNSPNPKQYCAMEYQDNACLPATLEVFQGNPPPLPQLGEDEMLQLMEDWLHKALEFKPTSLPESASTGNYIDFKNADKLKEDDIFLWLKFRKHLGIRKHIKSRGGFRLCRPMADSKWDARHNIKCNIEGIEIPDPDPSKLPETLNNDIKTVLSYVKDGVYIYPDQNGNIWAKRTNTCEMKVFAMCPVCDTQPMELSRRTATKIFDKDIFKDKYFQWTCGTDTAKPDPRIILSFGRAWNMVTGPQGSNVWATVVSAAPLCDVRLLDLGEQPPVVELSGGPSEYEGTVDLEHGVKEMALQ